ncbi:MAG: hypothetical protein IT376_21595 [Polyangiaceae bacterium]|nr:hypothetical protein [Polyangiaceae bacterium]
MRYAFGVLRGRVVSAYRVEIDADRWPVMPVGAVGAGRKYIPAAELDPTDWATAMLWTGIEMFGPVRYGDVEVDATGRLANFSFPSAAPTHDDELPDGTGGGVG